MMNKKAFSLIEVIISVTILSVVMLSLLQIKSQNINLISKSEQKSKLNDYILMAVDFKNEIKDKNETIFLDTKYNFENEEIKKEIKNKKVLIKDDKLESSSAKASRNILNIINYSRTYSLEDSDIKKTFYSFKIEL